MGHRNSLGPPSGRKHGHDPSTCRRHGAWSRIPISGRAGRTAAAALWLVVVVGCAPASGGDQTPSDQTPSDQTPSVAPSPSVAWTTFVSERHGYAIDHPTDWRVRETPGTVLPVGQRLGSSGTDILGSKDGQRYGSDDGVLSISTHDIVAGESLAEFTLRFSRSAACKDVGAARDGRTLGGETAEVRSFACGTHDWLQITAIHGGRGYVVWLVATQPPQPEQRPINDQLLATFRFTD